MDFDLPVYRKDRETGKLIENALKKSVYLEQIISDRRALKAIINAMESKKVNSKTYVAELGKPGEEMYVCEEGLLEMYNHDGVCIRKIGPGEVFGEMAFICFTKRKISVRAKAFCKLWVLNQSNYSKILRLFYTFQDEDYITFLRTIPVLRELSHESLLNIRKLVRVECYPSNTDIIIEGKEGSDFFILTGGTALVHATMPDGRMKMLDQLKEGDFFGEGAILGNGIRTATVTAEDPGVECILLDREHFNHFFGDLDIIRKAAKERMEVMRNIIENDIEYHFVKVEDLEEKGIISSSPISRIELVQYTKYPDLFFALKILKKAYLDHELVQNALNEKEILLSCRNPFIVRLYKTFSSIKHLYYLEEVYLGGDVRYLLEQRKNFDDNMTKFIAACVIEALDYLHKNNIVYGNLETKNLVFNLKGYIKLVDFGMARRITPKYDLIDLEQDGSNHDDVDPSTDFWFLGGLIYEMLIGVPPFENVSEENDTYRSDDKNVNFPVHVSKPARSIIRKMWKQKVCKAGEVQKLTVDDFRNQKWFLNFPWFELRTETLVAPYIPKIQYPTDLSNFAKAKKDKEIPPDCYNEWDENFSSHNY